MDPALQGCAPRRAGRGRAETVDGRVHHHAGNLPSHARIEPHRASHAHGILVARAGHGGVSLGVGKHVLADLFPVGRRTRRSEEHTSELQSLMSISYAVFCLKKKTNMRSILLYY